MYLELVRAATYAMEIGPCPPPMLHGVEWKYQLSLPTPRGPRDPAAGREVRPEVGLPEAPLEREDD